VKFDKIRNKYFLLGKIIQEEKPKTHAFTFLHEKNIEAFKKAKKYIDKQEYLIFVLFGRIDYYITLPFDGFDWVRKLVNASLIPPQQISG
jgi:hypothetical protein